MFNAVNKLTLCALVAATLAACGSSGSKDTESAAKLVADAENAIENHKYAEAIELLDTLQVRYPKEVEIQRKAMNVRPLAIEGLTISEMEQTDSLLAVASWQVDSLAPLFKTIADEKLVEPYRVIKSATGDLFSTTGIESRLTQAGEFYMISSLNGNPIKHTSVSLSSQAERATTDNIPYDDAINYRSGNSEMITFTSTCCDTLGRFAIAHDNVKLTLTFHGKRDYSMTLSP
ncbi:MAG: hypothetical protein K2L90_04260, partial [Muribaculaceae bacterium]|nr:hypothetical protein [Muribaculaceae bacterium]